MEKTPQVTLTILNEAKTKDGDTYFWGYLGMTKVTMWRAKSDPTKWRVVMAESPKDEQPRRGSGGGGYKKPAPQQQDIEDSIPF